MNDYQQIKEVEIAVLPMKIGMAFFILEIPFTSVRFDLNLASG